MSTLTCLQFGHAVTISPMVGLVAMAVTGPSCPFSVATKDNLEGIQDAVMSTQYMQVNNTEGEEALHVHIVHPHSHSHFKLTGLCPK